MKVCDRHPDKRATDTVHIVMDDSHIDVCAKCKTDVLELLNLPSFEDESEPPPKRRGFFKNLAKAL